jgi:hypothetical protein
MPIDDIQFIGSEKEEEKDFKEIADNLFGIKNIKQKTDLSKKEIIGIIYLEMLNHEYKKELHISNLNDEKTIFDIFIDLYTQYKVSEGRKGRGELVNSFIAKLEREREEEITRKEIV